MEKSVADKGFTLIELLVVIAIIAMLLAVLVPSLKRAKQQAQAVICLSRLKQWGTLYTLYANDYKSSLPVGWNSGKMWMNDLLNYYQNTDDLRLCPAAVKFLSEIPGNATGEFTAWGVYGENGYWTPYWGEQGQYGSYSVNAWTHNPLDTGVAGTYPTPVEWREHYWRKMNVSKSPFTVPLMGGGMWEGAGVLEDDPAPTERGKESSVKNAVNSGGMSTFCIDRHNKGPNWLFMDGQARKVGMKELWRLKWHTKWDNSKSRTSFPAWMDLYQSY